MHTPERREQPRARAFFELAAKNAYWRAGAFGVPFCTIMGFVRREPVFLLGFGFFFGSPCVRKPGNLAQAEEVRLCKSC